VFLKVLGNRNFDSLVKDMDLMDEGVRLVNQRQRVWRAGIGSHLKTSVEQDRIRTKTKAGAAIRFEIVDAQRADYKFKMSNPEVESLADRQVDWATSREIVYWPFNGEFWSDELGYYRYTEQGSCK